MAVLAEHVLVAGPSGHGKTSFLREYHDKSDRWSAFLTTKPNERKAAQDPPRRVRQSSCSYPDDIQRARKWAVGKDAKTQVIVDEVQNAPTFKDGADGPVRKMLHEDREHRVKAVICTQNPQDLHNSTWNYGPLQQCQQFIWVGESRTWHRGFREWLNLEQDQLPDSKFRWHAFRPTDPPELIETGRTHKKYG